MGVVERSPGDLGRLCQEACGCMRGAAGRLKDFPKLMARIIETRAWEYRVETYGNEVRLPSLRDLITRDPIEGWGENPGTVQKLLRDHPQVLAAYREAMLGQPGRPAAGETGNNIPALDRQDRGTSRAYSISLVQRECDAPTVAAVMAGEMSPNAALVKAGVRENRQVYLPRDPVQAVQKIRRVFGEEFLQAMLAAEATHATPRT